MARKSNGEPKVFAYEEFLAKARKEGRVRNEELRLDDLTLDSSLQARIQQLDLENVRKLGLILADGFELSPVVVFEFDAVLAVADGFHRSEAYKRHGRLTINAIVIAGSRQEAIEYATSCNRTQCLTRTKADAVKATRMLLGSGWLQKSCRAIADHTGLGCTTVSHIVDEWCAEKGISRPKTYVGRSGFEYSDKAAGGIVRPRSLRSGGTTWEATFYGQKYESQNRGDAQAWLEQRRGQAASRSQLIASTSSLKQHLARRGVIFDNEKSGGFKTVFGGCVNRFAVTSCPDVKGHGSESVARIAAAVGRAVLLAGHFGCRRSVVLVPYGDLAFKDLLEASRRSGVEFMTLDEFVAAVKAEQPASVPATATALA